MYGLFWVAIAIPLIALARNITLAKSKSHSGVVLKESKILERFGQKSKIQFSFVHIPKTGTTFATIIIRHCCDVPVTKFVNVFSRREVSEIGADCDNWKQPTTKNGDFTGHVPFRRQLDKGLATIILRDPASRLVSQLRHMYTLGSASITFGFRPDDCKILLDIFYLRYTGLKLIEKVDNLTSLEGFYLEQYQNNYKHRYKNTSLDPVNDSNFRHELHQCVKYKQTKLLNHNRTLAMHCKWHVSALYPGMLGCQTKMILGRTCYDRYVVTHDDVQEAKRRLINDFAFFGLTEYWNQSVRLFHTMYGGNMYIEEVLVQRININNEEKEDAEMNIKSVYDPYDSELYSFTKAHFIRNLDKYNIKR